MILDPDFLTHWKTRALVGALDDKCAPLYLIALWSHCQNRKQFEFDNLSPAAIKGICGFEGDAELLESSLVEIGFAERLESGTFVVSGWAEKNAQLFAAWGNGKKGGRPTRNLRDNQRDNPRDTRDEKRREEKRRNETNGRPLGSSVRLNFGKSELGSSHDRLEQVIKAIDPNPKRKLKPADRVTCLQAVALEFHHLIDLVPILKSCAKSRPTSGTRWGYFKGAVINACKDAGGDFHKLISLIDIPDEILKPPRPP